MFFVFFVICHLVAVIHIIHMMLFGGFVQLGLCYVILCHFMSLHVISSRFMSFHVRQKEHNYMTEHEDTKETSRCTRCDKTPMQINTKTAMAMSLKRL